MTPLFVPGPVDVAPEILAAQASPMMPHRSSEFETIFHRAENNSRKLFGTNYRVFITASSGTGLQEAAIRNFAYTRVLCCTNGAFGNRWFDVAKTNGKEVIKLEVPWGLPLTPDIVADALKNNDFDILTVVHNETSTGLENPIREIASAAREASPDTIICVDAVSSLGGVKIEMDSWGIDFMLTSSQKALALPPGLGLGATNDAALSRAKTVQDRGWYFDLVRLEENRIKNSTPATSAVSLIYALDKQLERILNEGLQERFDRHRAMAEKVQSWARDRDFSLFSADGYHSKTVTTIENSHQIDINGLNTFLLAKDMRIANGYGQLKDKTFRIAHMGELSLRDIDLLLSAIDEYMHF